MYVEVNGISIYYEKKGQGTPLLFTHGNSEDHRTFSSLVTHLSQEYTVYSIDSRAHGNSEDVEVLTYDDMCEDIASFIQVLNIKKPILVGFSDGGIIGLLLASKYANLLSYLVVCGACTYTEALKKKWLILMKIGYFFNKDKKIKLMLDPLNITNKQLNMISVPTLVLAGSNDMIYEKNTIDIASNIKNSSLVILKGESHSSYLKKEDDMSTLIRDFISKHI